MTTQSRTRLTYWDYMALPESDERYELIDGVLYLTPSPLSEHQLFLMVLIRVLDDFVRSNELGRVLVAPLDVVLSDEDVFQPDLLFISDERLDIITRRNVQGAPDLVVEVLSDATAMRDRTLKRERYAKYGVREYWMADIERRTIEVLALTDGELVLLGEYGEGDMLSSPLLDGIILDISDAFESAIV